MRAMRPIQHKREAYWFYRFLSLVYDRWVNPLFWTEPMREHALTLAELDDPTLERVLDVGAGTGFTTTGIVERVDAARVTMLDQSPHQLARARAKPALAACPKVLGDAEALPFDTDSFDRYVSAGSVEYWPDPQRAVGEAYRVLRPGGVALVIGPLQPGHPVARRLADAWMLFPPEADYRAWMSAAGFEDVTVTYVAPAWHRDPRHPYGLAIAGVKHEAGSSPLAPASSEPADEQVYGPLSGRQRLAFAARFVAGSAAGLAFVPLALALMLRDRLRGRTA